MSYHADILPSMPKMIKSSCHEYWIKSLNRILSEDIHLVCYPKPASRVYLIPQNYILSGTQNCIKNVFYQSERLPEEAVK